MRALSDWLAEYGTSHCNPVNKTLHWICIPPIVLSIMGLLHCLPVPAAVASVSPWLDWASLISLGAVVYYLRLSPALALGAALVFAVLLGLMHALATLPWPLWQTSVAIFVVGWIGQFIGHALEGKRPSFFKDLQFLLIGPLWLLAAAYRRLSVPY